MHGGSKAGMFSMLPRATARLAHHQQQGAIPDEVRLFTDDSRFPPRRPDLAGAGCAVARSALAILCCMPGFSQAEHIRSDAMSGWTLGLPSGVSSCNWQVRSLAPAYLLATVCSVNKARRLGPSCTAMMQWMKRPRSPHLSGGNSLNIRACAQQRQLDRNPFPLSTAPAYPQIQSNFLNLSTLPSPCYILCAHHVTPAYCQARGRAETSSS